MYSNNKTAYLPLLIPVVGIIIFFLLLACLSGCSSTDIDNSEGPDITSLREEYCLKSAKIDSTISSYKMDYEFTASTLDEIPGGSGALYNLDEIQNWLRENKNIEILGTMVYPDDYGIKGFDLIFRHSETPHNYLVSLVESNYSVFNYIASVRVDAINGTNVYYIVFYEKEDNLKTLTDSDVKSYEQEDIEDTKDKNNVDSVDSLD